ncbi:hypothetical protein L9F63_007803, partial [Diploptera punctata]
YCILILYNLIQAFTDEKVIFVHDRIFPANGKTEQYMIFLAGFYFFVDHSAGHTCLRHSALKALGLYLLPSLTSTPMSME